MVIFLTMALPCDIFLAEMRPWRFLGRVERIKEEIGRLQRLIRETEAIHGIIIPDESYEDKIVYYGDKFDVARHMRRNIYPGDLMEEMMLWIRICDRNMAMDVELMRRMVVWYMRDVEE
jgi:hypothetical protein